MYKSQGNIDKETLEGLFTGLQIPELSDEAVAALEVDLYLEELNAAISSFPNNKAPGPDGFSIDIFFLN